MTDQEQQQERAQQLAALAEAYERGEDISQTPEELQQALHAMLEVCERLQGLQ